MQDSIETEVVESVEFKVHELKNFFDLIANEVSLKFKKVENEDVNHLDINQENIVYLDVDHSDICRVEEKAQIFYSLKASISMLDLQPALESIQNLTIVIYNVGTQSRPLLAKLRNCLPNIHETSSQSVDKKNHGGIGGVVVWYNKILYYSFIICQKK
jgi:hypothetical protein